MYTLYTISIDHASGFWMATYWKILNVDYVLKINDISEDKIVSENNLKT